ncbi:Zn(2)-C6 fungal-type DNA-binding domain [Phaffia rhodozyma]|uniref:Zn(2)-C6 fungal-type DNA-binding domain n=1 Tax=Phaffia rhodozyma TaxID=264483 RepID=A0A0F7SV97_PHARH|nr:Zn(2)-C6 fungal-type DNA-binding domain [Phaffia rhodozyma]
MTTKSDKQPIRHRVEVACTRCRYRKTRCCGSRPSCQTCLKFKKECVYISIEDSKTISRGVYIPSSSEEKGRTGKRRSLTLSSEVGEELEAVTDAETSLAHNKSVGLASSTKVLGEDYVQHPYEAFFPTLSSSVPSTSSDAYEEPIELELGSYVEPDIFFHNQSAQSGTYEERCDSASPLNPIPYPPVYQSSPSEILTFSTTQFQNQPQQTTEPDLVSESYLVPALEVQETQVDYPLASSPTTYHRPTSVSLPEYTQQFSSTSTHPSHLSDPDYTRHILERTAGEPFFLDGHEYGQSPVPIPAPIPGRIPASSPMLSTFHAHSYPVLPPQEEPLGVVGWNPDLIVRRDVMPDDHAEGSLPWESLLR